MLSLLTVIKMRNSIYFLAIFSFYLNLCDLFTTMIALPLGAKELNPIINYGFEVMFGVKIILPTVITLIAFIFNAYVKDTNKIKILALFLALISLIWLIASINNVIVIYNQIQYILSGQGQIAFFK